MSAVLTEFDGIMRQAGYQPWTWDLRGDEVYIRHIASGGIDNPVYGYIRAGTVDEVRRELQALPKREPPVPGYCKCCCSSSSNLNIHNCQHVFTIRVEQACNAGDYAKMAEIIETARAQGIEPLGNWWKDYYPGDNKAK